MLSLSPNTTINIHPLAPCLLNCISCLLLLLLLPVRSVNNLYFRSLYSPVSTIHDSEEGYTHSSIPLPNSSLTTSCPGTFCVPLFLSTASATLPSASVAICSASTLGFSNSLLLPPSDAYAVFRLSVSSTGPEECTPAPSELGVASSTERDWDCGKGVRPSAASRAAVSRSKASCAAAFSAGLRVVGFEAVL